MFNDRQSLDIKKAELEKLTAEVKEMQQRIRVNSLGSDVALHDKVKEVGRLYDTGSWDKLALTCQEVYQMIGFDRVRPIQSDPEEIVDAIPGMSPPLVWPGEFGLHGIEVQRGTPVAVGALQGVGKTRWLLNVAYDVAKSGKTIVVYSIEMTPQQIWVILYAVHVFRVKAKSFSYASMFDLLRTDPKVRESAKKFYHAVRNHIIVVDAEGYTASMICANLDVQAGRLGKYPEWAGIDYLQIVEPEKHLEKKDNRERMIFVARAFKNKSKRTGTSFIQLSQLNSDNNFRESSEFKDAAAQAMIIQRKWDKTLDSWGTDITMRVIKNRFGHTMKNTVKMDGESGAIGI